MVDGVPTYVVMNNVTKRKKVLHQARLLLWLAEKDGKPLRINHISIDSSLTRVELVTTLHWSVKLGVVSCKLIYAFNTALFEVRSESSVLMMGDEACEALMGMPQNGTGHRIPCESKTPNQEMIWTIPRDVSAH